MQRTVKFRFELFVSLCLHRARAHLEARAVDVNAVVFAPWRSKSTGRPLAAESGDEMARVFSEVDILLVPFAARRNAHHHQLHLDPGRRPGGDGRRYDALAS